MLEILHTMLIRCNWEHHALVSKVGKQVPLIYLKEYQHELSNL